MCLFVRCAEKTDSSPSQNTIPYEEKADMQLNLNGVWGLSQYFDSIIKNKSIANYRIVPPSWFSLLIEIKDDSLYAYGSINEYQFKIQQKDTLANFLKTNTGDWILIVDSNKNELKLKNVKGYRVLDSMVYIFKKKREYKSLVDSLDKKLFHRTSDNLTHYFHANIFAGKYKFLDSSLVEFTSDGLVKGIDGYEKYEVDNYYGTYHPFNNLDNILLIRNSQDSSFFYKSELFNWVFIEDTLLLKRFDFEDYFHEGKKVREWEIWNLSDDVIKLIKISP